MKRLLKNQKGMTMMEVLVTVALLAIVIVPCLSAFVMAQRGNVLANQTYDTYREASNFVETLKGVSEDTWKTEIEEEVARKQADKSDGISIFGNFGDEDKYYEIRIYADPEEALEEEPAEDSPILKGVIAP